MTIEFLVQLPDGRLMPKRIEELLPDDLLVIDGPLANASLERALRNLDAEIDAAGGLDAWRASCNNQPDKAP